MSGWSAQQAQWLGALGYRVLVRREATWPAAAARGAAGPSPAAGPRAVPGATAAPMADPAPAAPRVAAPDAPPHAPAAPRTPPPRPRLEPVAEAIPAPTTPAPRVDASAKLVALAQARRERAFTHPRYAGLLEQVMRAAGLEGDAGRERLRSLEVDLPALHGDPAAKRALWPLLRGLRRNSRQ
ncbi:hypothetical protein [Lysobacter sp. GX 14042]|uniref:hypothetical protein n=1 Tax=Lysobacter sp. GX 14042 TaxID=2907155 RepID=UPI00272E0F3E|nr:hypothetical protein [Lysobacter sp. GX 14042]